MKLAEQKKAARQFAKDWEGRGYEKGESQSFWLSLLSKVYGVPEPEKYIRFEAQVRLDHTSFIDAYIDETRVMIEQKSIDKDLRKGIPQSDGSLLTPFEQAKRYVTELPLSQHPRWIITCNFREFYIYDMEDPQGEPVIIRLAELEEEAYRLNFIINTKAGDIPPEEMRLSVEAGDLVQKLYDGLHAQYIIPAGADKEKAEERNLKNLNVLCVRLVFCLYAEDAGLFGEKSAFHDFLLAYNPENLRDGLRDLFRILDQKPEERDPYISENLAHFPYVNGGLFHDTDVVIPRFTQDIIDTLARDCSEQFDWSRISPTIFGAIFESTLNPVTRHAGGMHYTSVQNIHKVIDPLFLDALREEFAEARAARVKAQREKRLRALQEKLASLDFLDPAAGSGNFLTETYLSLRRLENEILKELIGPQVLMGAFENPIRVSIAQFAGIEINDFAVTVAKTALWIAENQMMEETKSIVNIEEDFFPLKTAARIVEGNALRMDWETVLPKSACDYIMGNPPFLGYSLQSKEQKEDLEMVVKGAGKNIDYVTGWYFKAAEYMQGTAIRTALVSTNSITQGEQVAGVWKPLYERFGIHIDFAYRTFRWDSESNTKAHVHCVIVGFSTAPNEAEKFIYSNEKQEIAENINAYLLNAPDVFVERRSKPICDVPPLYRGSQPTDDGNLILTAEERDELLKKEPQAAPFIRPFMMGKDFIDRKPRYCLWLVGASPALLRKCTHVIARVERVRDFRLASKKAATRAKAETPMLFDEIRDCKTNYVAIPQVSSERRRYIPIELLKKEVIGGNMLFMMPDATLYEFGVLTSNVHMAWMRAVAGRLKSDYRYSSILVYNNFPWPSPTAEEKAKIEKTAEAILAARALYPEASLADLYDQVAMPIELRRAHRENDRAVMEAYRFDWRTMTESACVAALMRMYRALTEK